MDELEEAIDRVMAGPERKTRVISEQGEADHRLPRGRPRAGRRTRCPTPTRCTRSRSSPRGRALGYTLTLPIEDKFLVTRSELIDQLAMLLGGRTAEELVFHEPTTGAPNDIEKATADRPRDGHRVRHERPARRPQARHRQRRGVPRPRLGPRARLLRGGRLEIDAEVRRLIETAHDEAREILVDHRDVLDDLVLELMEKETLAASRCSRSSPRWWSGEHRPSDAGYGKRLPSDRPPILTPKEQSGNGSLTAGHQDALPSGDSA